MAQLLAPAVLPNSPAPDASGPAQPGQAAQPFLPGANALSTPGTALSDQLPLTPPPVSSGASIFQQLSAKNSPHLKALTSSVKSALTADPEAAAKPGGWAKALVGGAIDALGGNPLGDAAAVGTVPAGGGALTGIARTMAARGQRQAQQKQQQFANQQESDKNKILNAEANVRMIHEQRLVHNLGEEAKQTSLKSGLAQLETWRNQPSPAVEKMQGLTADDAKEQLKKDNLDPTEETMVPSGIKTMGIDKDGNPITQLTYSIVKPTPVDLDPKDPKQKAQLDQLNKYSPPDPNNPDKTWQGDANGKVHFSGPQFNMAMQAVNDKVAAGMAADRAVVDAGYKAKDIKRDKEALDFGDDPAVMSALANSKNANGAPDFISARNALLQQSQNPKSPLYGKYTDIDNDMRHAVGYTENSKGEKSYIYDKMLEDYQKKQDASVEQLVDLSKDVTKAHGEDAAAIASDLDKRIAQTNDPGMKAELTKLRDRANSQATASLDYDAKKKAAESEAESKISDGDMNDLVDMAKKYETDPDKLFGSRQIKGQKQRAEFEARMHREDPSWSFAEYRARFNTKNDFRPQGKGGIAKGDLNTFALHTGDASNLIQTLRNTGSPLLNTPLNKFKEGVLGQPQFLAYRTAMAAASENYINFLLANKAKHASDDELAEQLKSDKISPAMAQGVMRQMATTIAIKAREFNKNYKDQMKEDIPDLLDPNTVKVMQGFGIDPSTITDTKKDVVPTAAPSLPSTAKIAIKDGQGNTIGWK